MTEITYDECYVEHIRLRYRMSEETNRRLCEAGKFKELMGRMVAQMLLYGGDKATVSCMLSGPYDEEVRGND